MEIKNICCIGAGYVGGPTMAVIADKCPQIQVNVVDLNQERIKKWNDKNPENLPIFEPGLSEIVFRCRGKNLHFSNAVNEKIRNSDIVFISVNTPTKKYGVGAGKASDLKWVEACARQVASNASGHTIVVEKSTLPVRTAEVIKDILDASQTSSEEGIPLRTFDVLSNPEFLAEGTAIEDLLYPDRVLIGGENQDSIESLSKIYNAWVPNEKILKTNIWSSELAKLTANAFLAQRISSINAIGALCEATGADVREVSRAIGADSRIGSKFLDAGPGFGGSCFKKDILNLVYLCEYFGLYEVAKFWESVVSLNNWHQSRISKLITKKLYGTISGKKIVILGFSFKSNTNDTRESAAIQICKDLIDEGAVLFINDPKVNKEQIALDLGMQPTSKIGKADRIVNEKGCWVFVDNIDESLYKADAIVILTEWPEYKKINWDLAEKRMRKPAWIFDSRSLINPESIKNNSFKFWRIGDGS